MYFCRTSEKESLLEDASPTELKTKSDQIPEKDNCTKSTKDNGTDIKHITGSLNTEDLYAVPNKRKQQNHYECGGGEENVHESGSADEDDEEKGKREDSIEDKDANKDLPSGWEKHEGNRLLIFLNSFC